MAEVMSFDRALEKQRRIKVYIDGIDWQHHIEQDSQGVEVYPSIASLKANSEHSLDECGIVEVEVKLVSWVQEQDFTKKLRKKGTKNKK